METPYSKQDEVIDEGVQALREQAVDTSAMASVLNPRRRSIVLPVGLATAAAVAIGLVVLMAPTKADAASEFGKVIQAVRGQKAVVEKVMQRGKDELWEVKLEAWQDGHKKGVKYGPAKGGAEVVFDGKNKYVKKADEKEFVLADIEVVEPVERTIQELETVDGQLVFVFDLDKATNHTTSSINEILGREGMQFLGIQRNGQKDGRAADIYRVKMGEEKGERLYYVDPKTDLPFLLELVGPNGKVADRIELSFPGEITLELKAAGEGVFEIKSSAVKADLMLKESDLAGKVIELRPTKKN